MRPWGSVGVSSRDPAWRTGCGYGHWAIDQPIGVGRFSLDATFIDDGDGKAHNDPVVLTGTGVSGQARQMIQMIVTPRSGGMAVSEGSR